MTRAAASADHLGDGRRFTVGRNATATLIWAAVTGVAGFLTGSALSAGAAGWAITWAVLTLGAGALASRDWRRQAAAPRLTVRITPWPPRIGAMLKASWTLEDPAGLGLSVAAGLNCFETTWRGTGGEDQFISESHCLASLPLLHAPSGAPWCDGVEHVHLDLGSPPSFYSSDRTVTWALLLQVGDAGRSVRFTLSAP